MTELGMLGLLNWASKMENGKLKTPGTFAIIKAIIALPFMVIIVIPTSMLWLLSEWPLPFYERLPFTLTTSLGITLLLIGFPLFLQAVILFVKIGKGTLAPWNPTQKLVVRGLYRYMRNPMILGVFTMLLAEALFFRSTYLLLWATFFITVNHLYFIFREEPDLSKRFGEEYDTFKQNVPRWLPRLRPWRGEGVKE